MELDKLAKLSCLDVKDTDRAYFEDSLAGVVQIMDAVARLESETTDDMSPQAIVFDSLCNAQTLEPGVKEELVMLMRDEFYPGIHLEQGVFLAPKVIKKD